MGKMHSPALRWLLIPLLIAASVVLATDARADLKVKQGTSTFTVDAELKVSGGPHAAGTFAKSVQDCLDKIKAYKSKAGVVSKLAGSTNPHVIKKTTETYNWNATNGTTVNEGNGTGTGSTTGWDPGNTTAMEYERDGSGNIKRDAGGTPIAKVSRDPCASLLHELFHACDKDTGVMDRTETKTTTGSDTVKLSEIRAVQMENWYRKQEGLDIRSKYGGDDLPKGIQFDKCPDGICIYAQTVEGTDPISLPVTDIKNDLYYEVPVAGKDTSPIPGRKIPIKDALDNTLGEVTIIKQLDGKVKIRVECNGPDPVIITQIQFKNGGANLGPPVVLNPPLQCDMGNPKAESGEITPPPVP